MNLLSLCLCSLCVFRRMAEVVTKSQKSHSKGSFFFRGLLFFLMLGKKRFWTYLSNVIPSFNIRILSFLTFQLNHFPFLCFLFHTFSSSKLTISEKKSIETSPRKTQRKIMGFAVSNIKH